MSSFADRWQKKDPPLFSKVKDRMTPSNPLRPRISIAERKIKLQMSKMEIALSRISDRDAYIFRKVVLACQRQDPQRASIYANELSEVRKLGKLVTQAKLALHQVVLRLNTVRDLGDAVTVISPILSVVKNVGSNLSYVIPEAQGEIGEISNILGDIMVDAGDISGNTHIDTKTTNEEADKILVEASTLAEKRMKELFPAISTQQLQGEREQVKT
ncbi:MAG: Snf7 family protein [Nitrososphaerales archaeon]|jgi:division protein CdvB (Snf7/Vps24/ESCRT-III family)|nr:Snf7 family protein [Nitrososphaerales archaeon]